MKSYVVPMSVEGSAYFTQTVNLSGHAFSFRFLWNERDQHFYMDVETNYGKKNSVKLVPNNALLGKSSVTDLGDFYLLSQDSSADPEKIEYSQYGSVWNLYWIPFDQED